MSAPAFVRGINKELDTVVFGMEVGTFHHILGLCHYSRCAEMASVQGRRLSSD